MGPVSHVGGLNYERFQICLPGLRTTYFSQRRLRRRPDQLSGVPGGDCCPRQSGRSAGPAPGRKAVGVRLEFRAAARCPPPVPSPEQQGSAAYRAHVARRPKRSYAGLIAGVAAVAVIGLSAYINRGWLAGKWRAFHGASAAGNAADNQASPASPDLAAADVWQNVVATYKGLTSLSATGTAETALDMGSGIGATNRRHPKQAVQ